MTSEGGRVSYIQSFRKCGKPNCSTCRSGKGHGPYWYATWRDGGSTRSFYVGRKLPESVPVYGISVSTLGKLEVVLPNGSAVVWRRRVRELFTMLLSAPYGTVGRDEIAYSLWPEHDSFAAFQNLRVTISALRKSLGPRARVTVTAEGVGLDVPAESRDDIRFERAATAALGREEFNAFEEAMTHWGGQYLPNDVYCDWTQYRRLQLASLCSRLVQEAAVHAQSISDLQKVEDWLRRIVIAEPTDEASVRTMMEIELKLGNRSQAVRLFRELSATLGSELSIEPDPATVAVYERALAG